MRHPVPLALLGIAALVISGCAVEESKLVGSPTFPIEPHLFTPQYDATNGQIAAGMTTGASAALEQPIAFPHYTHVTTLEMNCEYCHSDARKSIHGGVPATQVCMNCHQMIKQSVGAAGPSAEIAKVVKAYQEGTPIEWKKVHDLPDYVHFAHSRHVNAGVQCTECHGQVGLQGQYRTVMVEGEGEHAEPTEQSIVQHVFIRETTLQMGWCLDCHASHPSVDKNYGDDANTRRAELKDCWTCHK